MAKLRVNYHVNVDHLYHGDDDDTHYNAIALGMNAVHGDDSCAVRLRDRNHAVADIARIEKEFPLPTECANRLADIAMGGQPKPFAFHLEFDVITAETT